MVSEELHPEQVRTLRKMTVAQRLEIGLGFVEQMRELRATMLRREHPDWTPAQIASALRDFTMNGRS